MWDRVFPNPKVCWLQIGSIVCKKARNFAGLLYMCSVFVMIYQNCEFHLIISFASLSLRTETYTEMCGEFSKISLENTLFIRI